MKKEIKEKYAYWIGFLFGILISLIPLILIFYGFFIGIGIIQPEKILKDYQILGNLIVAAGSIIFLLILITTLKFKIDKIEKQLKELKENGN